MSHGVLRDEDVTCKPVQHRVLGDKTKITTERHIETGVSVIKPAISSKTYLGLTKSSGKCYSVCVAW